MTPLPLRFRLSDQAAEVPRRPCIAGSAGDRQQPLRRDPSLRYPDPLSHQLGDRVVVMPAIPAAPDLAARLEAVERFSMQNALHALP